MPDISVIIAAYNVEAMIECAIESALAQQGVTIEVIVADDASTDGTLAAARRIDDSRVTIIALPHNGGPGAARNAAIGAATAEWIAVLDGDDEMERHRLVRCLACAKEARADIVADNLTMRQESGRESPMFDPRLFAHLRNRLTLADFIAGNCSFLGGAALGYLKPVFSRAFLQKHSLSYDADLRIGEDYMLLAECLAEGAGCALEPSAGYLYTVRAGSTSHRLTREGINRIEESDRKFLSRYRLDDKAARAQARRTSRLHDARAFTELVIALKDKDVCAAFELAAARPAILWYLWRPIAAQLLRKHRKAGGT
ncbi:MAG: glycosyltransferase family 2 protein [Alphaproteobacteria bacterium]|nr:glycosyltransferase family 2 protein [Alphaproteobacteria bacterium]